MTDKIIHVVIKVLFYIFLLLLLIYLFVQMKHVGYLIFADKAKDSPETAKEMVLTVTEEESLIKIGKDLAKKEIVDSPYIFAAALRCMEEYKNIQPGEYVINSSQKPSEILGVLAHKEEQKEE